MKRAIVRLVLLIGAVLGGNGVAGTLEDATAAYGRGDYATALPLFRSLGDHGNPAAQVNLGYMYANGRGVVKSDVEAVKWFRKAAEQGDASGQNELGLMYRNGRGVTRDDAAAVAWFSKAAEQGNAHGEVNLGAMYESGRGVAKDDGQAVQWYRKAAEQGNAYGQNDLGFMYEKGRGIAQDDAQALQWYRKAAEQGAASGENNLGRMYRDGRGITRDDAAAVDWFRKAAEQGDSNGKTNLGSMYETGRGVAQDDGQALEWYRRAALQGNAYGQNNLGRMYRDGRGITRDDAAAFDWFHKAAEQGLANAQVNLGSMYEQGHGVAEDETEAVTWYRRAAAQGNVTAEGKIRDMFSSQTVTNGAKGDAAVASGIATANRSNCKLVQIADWPVRLERNQLIVDGAINGQKIGVMLDTGASRSMILRSAAVRLGLGLKEVRGYRMFGVGGETHVEAALIDEFKIGQAARKGWRVLVGGEHNFGSEYAFILGEDFFHLADVEFDLAHKAIRLYQPNDCHGVSLAYWATNGASETEIEAVDDVDPQILLTVQINGQPVRALLDSGASTSVLTKSDAARLGVTPETPGVVAVGSGVGLGTNAVDSWIGPFASFAIGNEVIRDTTIRFADLWKDVTYTSGDRIRKHLQGWERMLLGADFLRAHRLLVAHSQRKLYFTYAGGHVFERPPQASATATDAKPTTTQPAIPAKTQ